MMPPTRCTLLAIAAAATLWCGAPGASASPPIWPPIAAGASTPNPFDPVLPPILGPGVGAHVSHNWFGYEQGARMRSGAPFASVAAGWTVPRAQAHQPGQAEAAADWIGIGGGCIDQACSQTDPTLIQAGTIDTISAAGGVSYQAWYELIPAPPQPIANMTVQPGDQMRASLTQQPGNPDVWQVSMRDVSRGEAVSMNVPYRSNRSSVEWIEETPMRTGPHHALVPLPTLTQSVFRNAQVNGASAALAPAQETKLRAGSGVIGVPSAPVGGGDAFAVCAWTTRCS